jgi:VIT1/CCC1 family predicted Fe2+/Mn2+ transporter
MSESTKRALRTAYQAVASLLAVVPTVLLILQADLPLEGTVATVIATTLAWFATATKVMNSLEDAGLIPAWLKDSPDTED